MRDDESSQATDDGNAGYPDCEEVLCGHFFFGVAYPNTPASAAQRIER